VLFGYDFGSNLAGFFEFRAGFFASKEIGSIFTDGARYFAAGGFDLLFEVVAWLAECAGDDPGGAGEGECAGRICDGGLGGEVL